MLRELHISNLAVIEDLTVELAGGLNCFTGQTGAGKSLILGALELLLGLRAGGADMIRPGAQEARVSGVFAVRDAQVAAAIAQAADLVIEAGDELLLTRKLHASGRSSASLNGQPATAAMIRAVAEQLVDVHGQHDQQFLLKPSNQLLILDDFADSADLREQYAAIHGQLRDLRQQRDELTSSGALRAQQLDLYQFQADEIDKVNPQPGEFPGLQQRHALLSNTQKLKRDAGSAYAALYEAEGAVLERLQMIAHVVGETAILDPRLQSTAEQVRTATLSLQDAAYELQRYVDRLEMDPEELTQVEDRLNHLHRLISKYAKLAPTDSTPRPLVRAESRTLGPDQQASTAAAGAPTAPDPLAAVLAYRAHLAGELDRLRHADQDLTHLDADLARLQKTLVELGRQLSQQRQAAGKELSPLVEKQMHELGMGEAQFHVEFTPLDPGQSITGLDQIEMMVRTNPGQPARPLRKIASGGEMSRIMLALKSILAQSDRVSVLVFDEIDANIGGRLGTVIGGKLRRLALGAAKRKSTSGPKGLGVATKGGGETSWGGHQVLCITHLPQIAAFADRHFRIAKEVSGKGSAKETRTQVAVLAGAQRVEELAEMLAGKDVSATTRRQVGEMLAAAEV